MWGERLLDQLLDFHGGLQAVLGLPPAGSRELICASNPEAVNIATRFKPHYVEHIDSWTTNQQTPVVRRYEHALVYFQELNATAVETGAVKQSMGKIDKGPMIGLCQGPSGRIDGRRSGRCATGASGIAKDPRAAPHGGWNLRSRKHPSHF